MITGLDLYELIEECRKHSSKIPYFSEMLCRFLSQVDPFFDEYVDTAVAEGLINNSRLFKDDENYMQNFFDRLIIQMTHSVVPGVSYHDLSEAILENNKSKYLLEGSRKIDVESHSLTILNGVPNSIDDKPAFEYNRYKIWMKQGEVHRELGPAEVFDKDKFWFKNGMKHNSIGPAVVVSNGSHKEWWYLGKKYPVEEWLNILRPKEMRSAIMNSDNF